MSATLGDVLASLDAAMVELPDIADAAVERAAVEEKLSGALMHVYAAISVGADPPRAAVDAQAALALARAAAEVLQEDPTEDPAVARCLASCAEAIRRLIELSRWPLSVAMTFSPPEGSLVPASVDVPRVLRAARALLRPAVPVAADEPAAPADESPPEELPATGLDALRAENLRAIAAVEGDEPVAPQRVPLPEGPSVGPAEGALFEAVMSPHEINLDRARQCIEDLAMLGRMRRPTDEEPWCAPRTEARLLARIDALLACGVEVYGALVHALGERPVPDPELTWALLMLFGSLDGDDALHQCLRIARSADASLPELRDALSDALALAPHDGFAPGGAGDAMLRSWRAEVDAGRRVIALGALGRRGRLTLAEAAESLRDSDVEVARAAAGVLWRSVGEADGAWWSAALQHPDATVATEVLRASILRGRAEGIARALALTEEGHGDASDAAMAVALGADARGWDALRAGFDRRPDRAVIVAMGWCGHRDAIPALLDALGDAALAPDAARALWRISGVAPDETSGPLDLSSRTGEPDPAEDLSVSRDDWQRVLGRTGAALDARTRWRFGHPWRFDDTLWELGDAGSRPPERRAAHLELVARSGLALPLDPDHFVARQRAQLDAWRERCASLGGRGAWPTAAFDLYSAARRGPAGGV